MAFRYKGSLRAARRELAAVEAAAAGDAMAGK